MKMLRRGVAMLLSVALVFSFVAVVAETNWTGRTSLGMLSRYYETGSIDDEAAAGVISTVPGDPGGKSYGAYMFASKSGTVEDFISWCLSPINYQTAARSIGETLSTAYYSGGAGCGPLFDQAWTSLAAKDAKAFFTAQEEFVKDKIYKETIKLIREESRTGYPAYPNFDIDRYSVALKNVIWSRAVHHGPSGAACIVKDAFASLGGFTNQAERDLIMAIYNQSGKVVDDYSGAKAEMNGSLAAKYDVDGKVLRYWYGSSAGVQLAVYRRLNVNEPADALSMLQTNAFEKAHLSEGNYTISVTQNASTLALGLSSGTIKVVNTAGENAGTPAKFTLNYLSGVDAYTISTTMPTDNNGTKTMRLSATPSSDTVSLSEPSASEYQLWYIDRNGMVTNAKTGAKLACRNDTLIVVGEEGADVTQTVTVNAATDSTNTKKVTAQPATEGAAVPTVTYVAGDYGTFTADEALVLATTDNTSYTLGTLPTISPKEDYSFAGWYTTGSDTAVTADAAATDGLKLYARYDYTTTSTISPSAWTFSPVVTDASDITVLHHIYPNSKSELHEDNSSFPVRGMISCSGTISDVTLTVSSSSRTISKSVDPNASYYDLSNMDSSISYSSLDAGEYNYSLTVTPEDGEPILIKSSDFVVLPPLDEKDRDESTPSEDEDISGGTDIDGDEIVNTEGFTVTFVAGEKGTSSYTSKTYALDSIVYGELPSVNVKSSFVEFVGWFTADGEEVRPTTTFVPENITLYAKYTSIYTYTFTGASGKNASGSAAAGTIFYAPSGNEAPIRYPDGQYRYDFSHWADGVTNNEYKSGQAIVMGEGNVTFTAVYKKVKINSSTPDSSGTTTPPSGGGGGGGGGSSMTTTPSGAYWPLTPGTSVSQLDGATVYSDGKVVSNGNVGTGMTVKTSSGEYTITVTGDMSGDGKITVTDVVKLQSHLLNKSSLTGAYLEAADLNADKKVSITDLVKSARVVAGKDTIG